MFIPDNDVGIGFIIFQVDIKNGLVLFDQGVFKQERILFRIDNRKLDPTDPFYQFMCFIAGKCFIKIGTNSFSDIFCLAYV